MYEEIVKIFIWSSEVHCTAVVKVVQTFVAFSEKLNFNQTFFGVCFYELSTPPIYL